jgi:hypothetical protein
MVSDVELKTNISEISSVSIIRVNQMVREDFRKLTRHETFKSE